ncbi:hypothetical protein BBO99_00004785 [Phytophthora kernoviae]|uniref:Uncharacterized protein n=2 Tax=Phytophthora kernoviae TaxID=325452 RepID=A0A3R7JU97_9STRA|nr:hypothetical protein G195_010676 [Phytophthora kernoviae 00238/432]KAG2523185.1 hypothetical protein JM18_004183 [Phytophthora kernoviae]KAG2525153.1 hypothetical protein JM16_004643 [Phytophthora kernoviae]RLN26003.1 hypothetical protein BBI17_004929 [Phytophthora kernoviae]RLN80059.1 hypothetical protein BBO99_00004785 [Phytophthora kernoviae]
MKQNSKTERLYKAPKTTLRIIMGVILLVTSFAALSVSLRAWKPSNSQFDEQFEQLERRFSLLGRATARLETSASRFLKNCQNVQIAAKVRTEMLANSAKKSFEEQAQAEVEEQEQVMKEVMEYYTQQEQQIQETKQRLLAMNITLPVQVTVIEDLRKPGGDASKVDGTAIPLEHIEFYVNQ